MTIAFPGSEELAILGGIYDFMVGPVDPTDPTDPTGPTDPGNTGWLGTDDIITTSLNAQTTTTPLANDNFPSGGGAAALIVSGVTHGSLLRNGSSFEYTPNAGFSGVDTFRYHIVNGDDEVMTTKTSLGIVVVGTDITVASGTDSDETLNGGGQRDALWGKLGDDTLLSGGGSDTYIYSRGDGNDYIDDEAGSTTNVDALKFTDINLSDVTFTLDSVNSVFVTVNSTGGVITLDEQSYDANEGWGLERIDFADGVSINLTHSRDEAWTYNGTNGNDSITGAIWGQKDIFSAARVMTI
ncbi:Ig-like domain-containing protein [Shinella sp.]|uniref:Ig-like domain-containing protein n=1 Tax=Shinella sp. TaxID=1870904 RepID=UPI00403540DC